MSAVPALDDPAGTPVDEIEKRRVGHGCQKKNWSMGSRGHHRGTRRGK